MTGQPATHQPTTADLDWSELNGTLTYRGNVSAMASPLEVRITAHAPAHLEAALQANS